MTMEIITRFHFEPLEKFTRSTSETVRLSKNKVSITNALYERMGKPEYLAFGWDGEKKALGIRVTVEADPEGVEVTFYDKTSVTNIKNSTFVARKVRDEMHCKEDEVVVMKRGFKEAYWYVFELKNAEVQKKCGRKSKWQSKEISHGM